MSSVKDLKKRIVTVKNTQQTTRAMKLVSASKLRKAQEAIQNQRPYAREILNLIYSLRKKSEHFGKDHQRALWVSEGLDFCPKNVLVIVVTSDRGLCGAFNSNVLKVSQKCIQNSAQTFSLSFIGRKGYDFYKIRKVNIVDYYSEMTGKIQFSKVDALVKKLIKKYQDGEFDQIKFVYNEFKNAISQRVVVEDFLPIVFDTLQKSSDFSFDRYSESYIVEPNIREVFGELIQKNFTTQAFRILLESQAGEHGARMSAMENATQNAGEMIQKLTLQYNKQRQAGITKELLEIISGSESQKV